MSLPLFVPAPLPRAKTRRRQRVPTCARHAPSPEPRPDGRDPYPAFLPQTIEHALLRAQGCVVNHLRASDDDPHTDPPHVLMRVELPMGRSRRFWYRMSPPAMAVRESSVLALHFAQIFKGLRLVIAMAEGAEPAQKVDWAAVVDLSDASRVVRDAEVVVVVGAGAGRRREVDQVLEASRLARAVVLFNCLMDAPIEDRWERAEDVYVCRAMDKCAVLREGAGAPWSVFVEIAVFEYEWVGDRREEAGWVPAQGNVERYVASRGASKKVKGYWSTAFSGCEGGFWPFMTIAMTETLPIDGRAMEEERQEKAEKKNKKAGRPFGFF